MKRKKIHKHPITHIKLIPKNYMSSFINDYIITGDESGTVVVWNCVKKIKKYKVFKFNEKITSFSFLLDLEITYVYVSTLQSFNTISIHDNQSDLVQKKDWKNIQQVFVIDRNKILIRCDNILHHCIFEKEDRTLPVKSFVLYSNSRYCSLIYLRENLQLWVYDFISSCIVVLDPLRKTDSVLKKIFFNHKSDSPLYELEFISEAEKVFTLQGDKVCAYIYF